MGWTADCGYDPAYDHEGHLVTSLDDGTESEFNGWSPEISPRIGGWYIGCSCGWRDDQFWPRDPADEVGHPPDELDGDEHGALYRRWRAHLDEALPEIRVAEAAVLASDERDRLDDAVGLARTFGASWAAVAEAAGMSKQAAHERWGGLRTQRVGDEQQVRRTLDQRVRESNARLLRQAADDMEAAGPRDPADWLRQRADTITFGQLSI